MKKLYTVLYISALFIMASGCTNEADYDRVIAGGNSKVFIKTYDNSNKGLLVKSLNVISTPVGVSGNSSFKLPVSCTEKVFSSVKVTVAAKPDLLASYNQLMNTSYKVVPSEAVNLENAVVTIQKGMDSSSDSVSVTFSKEQIAKLEDGTYVLPLAITKLDRDDLNISSNMGVLYVKLVKTSDTDNIWDNADITTLPGSWVTNKSGWSCNLLEGKITGNVNNLVDGNRSTYIYTFAYGKVSIAVDLGKEYQSISAIQFIPYSSYYSIASIRVWHSTDGTTWVDNGTATPVEANEQFVAFYKPLNARYIKFELYNSFVLTEFSIRTL